MAYRKMVLATFDLEVDATARLFSE